MARIQRALISVSDKRDIIKFAQGLKNLGVEIISTGGTARTLRSAKLKVKDVSEHTKFPEMLGGRVKTLHPKIHGGLLWRRDDPKDKADVEANNIESIDLVAVNLYPFEETVSKLNVAFEEATEKIDIGGPTMLRSAAKNFKDVAVIVDPADYPKILDELTSHNGTVSYDTKFYLAKKVFAHTARYDVIIANYLERYSRSEEVFPVYLNQSYLKVFNLRYGENPHQKAALYREPLHRGFSLVDAKILQGKEMSFNNYLDSSSALDLVKEFEEPATVIVKHNNPCGVAIGKSLHESYKKSFETDPVSAFGGVIAVNRNVDVDTAKEILKLFVEVVIAPGFEPKALKLLKQKPNIRLLEIDVAKDTVSFDIRKIQGGVLMQEKDTGMVEDFESLQVVTKRKPMDDEVTAQKFAWKVCKHVKSNAIVYTSKDQALGIGVGQTSRVDAAKLGAMKALKPLERAVVGSDAFFPHRDGIDFIAKLGVTAIIQPGGSVKDKEVIAAADEYNLAMIFTGMRHFKH